MTTYNYGGMGQTNQLDHVDPGFTINASGMGNSDIFEFDNDGTFSLMGRANTFSLIKDHSDSVFLGGMSNHLGLTEGINDTVSLGGAFNTVALSARGGYTETGNTVNVSGINNAISIASGGLRGGQAYDTVDDRGHGTKISIGNQGTHLTLQDFQHDGAGKIDLTAFGIHGAQAVPMEQSDGHGGTALWVGSASIDFVGDAHVSASHFV